MEKIKYKDFIGSIEFCKESNCFFGKILNISDLVSYESESLEFIEESFKKAVDDYLETCKELKKEPNKIYKEMMDSILNKFDKGKLQFSNLEDVIKRNGLSNNK